MLAVFARSTWHRWILGGLALLCTGFAARDALTAVFSRSNPALVLSIDPADPRAMPLMMETLALGNGEPPARATERLRRGLATMPLSSRALRLLGETPEFQRPPERGARLLALAGNVSRRDKLTQVRLAEAALIRADAKGTMQHINAALSTSRSAHELLFPLLTQALRDREFRPTVAQYVDHIWGDEFLYFAAQNGDSANVLDLALRNPAVQREDRFAAFRGELIGHLVADGRTPLAVSYARRVMGSDAPVTVDPRFSAATTDPRLAPLSWRLTNNGGLFGDATASGAHLSADPGARGTALERVMALAPGRWSLASTVEQVAASRGFRAEWHANCVVGRSSRSLAIGPASPRAARLTFTVPESCEAVRLSVMLYNPDDQNAGELRITGLALTHSGD